MLRQTIPSSSTWITGFLTAVTILRYLPSSLASTTSTHVLYSTNWQRKLLNTLKIPFPRLTTDYAQRQRTVLVIQWLFWLGRHHNSLVRNSGLHTVRILIPWTTKFGVSCRKECIERQYATWTIWSNAWLTPGLGCSSQSSMKQLTGGASGSRPARKPKEGTLNTYCNCLNCFVSALTWFSTRVFFAWTWRFPLWILVRIGSSCYMLSVMLVLGLGLALRPVNCGLGLGLRI